MSLRFGIPPVDPERRICINCQHFCQSIDPHSGYGECDIALDGGLFKNHTRFYVYMARHSNSRYYTQKACKTRFISNKLDE